MCSPVLHRMIWGNFRESAGRKLEFLDVDGRDFGKVLNIWCGQAAVEEDLTDVRQLGSVADRFQIIEVLAALEETMLGQLAVE
jgi:hypothetical protein